MRRVTFDLKESEREATGTECSWQRNSLCKGPEAESCLAPSSNCMKAGVPCTE